MTKTKKSKPVVLGSDIIPTHKLDLWLKHRYNVLFEGKHGVGKTSIILAAFKRAGLKYAYFSGATMDPFIDFVGVPVKVKDSAGHDSIELIRPKHMTSDIQVIFIDEFNRTHKKIRNAVMELMQFKTINGKPVFKDLRAVWAAVNPEGEDSEYDVDRLDPAQQDRFHVYQMIPYQCSAQFFEHKFGKMGTTAVKFWNKLSKEAQNDVSPRRLEYALEIYKQGGDIRDALPLSANPSKLTMLLSGKGYQELDPLLKDQEAAGKFFKDEENFTTYVDDVLSTRKYWPLLSAFLPEKLGSLLGKKKKNVVKHHIMGSIRRGTGTQYQTMLESIAAAKGHKALARWCQYALNVLVKKITKATAKVAARPKAVGGKVTPSRIPIGLTRTSIYRALLGNSANTGVVVTVPVLQAAYKKRTCAPGTVMSKVRASVIPWLKKRGFVIAWDQSSNGWLVKF